MRTYGYDKEKCDELKRERKNLYNKLYRRRQKQKKVKPSSKESQNLSKDIERIKGEIDILNSQIWKCSEQYANIKIEQRRIRDKIRYRQQQIEKKPKTKKATKFRKEVTELREKLDEKEQDSFLGSPRYRNLRINKKRLQDRINYLGRKLKKGNIKKNGKLVNMNQSDRNRITAKQKELGDDLKMIEEMITGVAPVDVGDYERTSFVGDAQRGLEEYEGTIFNYRVILDDLLSRRKIKTVTVGSDISGGYETMKYPNNQIELMFTLAEIEAKLGQDASEITVIMLLDTKEQSLSVMFLSVSDIMEDNRQPFTKPKL